MSVSIEDEGSLENTSSEREDGQDKGRLRLPFKDHSRGRPIHRTFQRVVRSLGLKAITKVLQEGKVIPFRRERGDPSLRQPLSKTSSIFEQRLTGGRLFQTGLSLHLILHNSKQLIQDREV